MGILAQLSVGLLIVLVLEYQRTYLLLQSLEHVEESGNNHNLTKHTYQHTSDGSRTQRHVTIVTYAHWPQQRSQTDNHGQ